MMFTAATTTVVSGALLAWRLAGPTVTCTIGDEATGATTMRCAAGGEGEATVCLAVYDGSGMELGHECRPLARWKGPKARRARR